MACCAIQATFLFGTRRCRRSLEINVQGTSLFWPLLSPEDPLITRKQRASGVSAASSSTISAIASGASIKINPLTRIHDWPIVFPHVHASQLLLIHEA